MRVTVIEPGMVDTPFFENPITDGLAAQEIWLWIDPVTEHNTCQHEPPRSAKWRVLCRRPATVILSGDGNAFTGRSTFTGRTLSGSADEDANVGGGRLLTGPKPRFAPGRAGAPAPWVPGDPGQSGRG